MICSNFDINDGVIYINNEKIDLPFPVAEALEYEQSVIVRVDPPAKEIFNSNIYRFTLSGDCLWQIESSPHGTEDNKPYVSIYTSSSHDSLVVSNWNGVDYIVNIEDGSVEVKSFRK